MMPTGLVGRILGGVLGWLALSIAATAQNQPFQIRNAMFSLDQTLLQLDLVVASEIPEYIEIALEQGFAVPMMFEIEILARNDYWFDDKVVTVKQQYRLHHQPILDSYVVFDVNNSVRHYFDSGKAAVRFVEVVYNYPMLDINNLMSEREYYARVRFGIDTDTLPLPLKSSSLWDNDWDLQSDWYEWEVIRPKP